MEELVADAAADASEDLDEKHRELLDDFEREATRVEELETASRDNQILLADQTAQLQATRTEFEDLLRRRLGGPHLGAEHPMLRESIETKRCSVCGTEGEAVAAELVAKLDNQLCPLCNSTLPAPQDHSPEELTILNELDNRIIAHETAIENARLASKRLTENLNTAKNSFLAITRKLSDFERANELALARTTGPEVGVKALMDGYRGQILELLDRKSKELKKRNDARSELRTLQKRLTIAYADAEEEFLPRFQALAQEFLGLDLELNLQTIGSNLRLVVSVQNTARRAADKLSESQRFFLDIALRMALAQQMAGTSDSACLFIDTPEGSLDIAYESRAGRMFGSFVLNGNQLIMTANINTSQLLHKLAESCGPNRMKLVRMTEWTALSEVQAEEEDLFDRAYGEIESALEAGG